jgi:hypothetical protein
MVGRWRLCEEVGFRSRGAAAVVATLSALSPLQRLGGIYNRGIHGLSPMANCLRRFAAQKSRLATTRRRPICILRGFTNNSHYIPVLRLRIAGEEVLTSGFAVAWPEQITLSGLAPCLGQTRRRKKGRRFVKIAGLSYLQRLKLREIVSVAKVAD